MEIRDLNLQKKKMVYWLQPHIFSSSVVIKVKIQDNKNQNQIFHNTHKSPPCDLLAQF